jgi:hypothetical protein
VAGYGLVYPACTAFTWEHDIGNYAFLARAFNDAHRNVSDEEAAGSAYEEITKFLKQIKL